MSDQPGGCRFPQGGHRVCGRTGPDDRTAHRSGRRDGLLRKARLRTDALRAFLRLAAHADRHHPRRKRKGKQTFIHLLADRWLQTGRGGRKHRVALRAFLRRQPPEARGRGRHRSVCTRVFHLERSGTGCTFPPQPGPQRLVGRLPVHALCPRLFRQRHQRLHT